LPRFAANLDWLFYELPFIERFASAAAAGFNGVEFLFPYDYPIDELQSLLIRHKLKNVLFNLPAGDWAAGDRGIASLPGREAEFRETVERAIPYAIALQTPRLHVLAGIVLADRDREEHRRVYIENLRYAANRFRPYGITLLVEAINSLDMPGYLIQTQAESFDTCTAVNADNIKMQLDLYHMQMTEGNLATGLRRYQSSCGHVQIAGAPGRNEPDTGEVNYPYLFRVMDEIGYEGWVGCEYRPRKGTVEGLGWYADALSNIRTL
jgi:2-dehydrotetronate isomerase